MFQLFAHRMKVLMQHKLIFPNNNIIHIQIIIYINNKICILAHNILVILFLLEQSKIMKCFFFPLFLEYQMQHPYTPSTTSTQISNQSQTQYPAPNSQQAIQPSQTSQQPSVMIIYSFKFQNIKFFFFV